MLRRASVVSSQSSVFGSDEVFCHCEERMRRSNPCGRRQALPVTLLDGDHIAVVTAFYSVSRFARLARPGNVADA